MSSCKAATLGSLVLFLLAMSIHASVVPVGSGCTCSPNPTATFVVYIQDVTYIGTNGNYTSYPVAGIQGTQFINGQFGTINVYDDPVTVTASPNSTVIGRLRGFFAVAALGGGRIFISSTFQFTGGKYANSTLNIKGLGQSVINVPAYLGIDGGTNAFNGAIGNVTLYAPSRQGPNTVIQATFNYRTAN
ncbi:hypothetical protein MLD38_009115 [Melastoma candidum]|uniref:Uncharacterized protein n=1 Tax=Melastoma candidum TaxID=119954 RepID=A0ACB9RXT9_9MYRT|nr:hypothetical protein MLD38_009115 [Melastoma candidum]